MNPLDTSGQIIRSHDPVTSFAENARIALYNTVMFNGSGRGMERHPPAPVGSSLGILAAWSGKWVADGDVFVSD